MIIKRVTLALSLLLALTAHTQDFAKFFRFSTGNPFAGTTFISAHELHDSSGFVILGDRWMGTYRNSYLIRTDSNLTEVWTRVLNFQNAAYPYDNITFHDVGQLLNGNIYAFGTAGFGGNPPHYVLFILDAAGQILHHRAFYDAQNSTNLANIPKIHLCTDSSILIGACEWERYGYYRVDQQLNLMSSAFYVNSAAGPFSSGRDAIMLQDTTLLINTYDGLTKTDINGTHLWSNNYTTGMKIFCLYEAPGGSIYAGGYANPGPVLPALAKYDANGNPVFVKYYQMAAPVNTTSGIWNMYPDGNNLMFYCDSVMFATDTNGNVIGTGKTVNSQNYKVFKPSLDNKFLLTGLVFQDSTMQYEYTLMKFDNSTQQGCLHPRPLTTTSTPNTATAFIPAVQTCIIVLDSINYASNFVNLDFDALNGCPPDPSGVEEMQSDAVYSIYPNPASDHVHFTYSLPGNELEILIYDARGRLISTLLPDSNGNATLDATALESGLYSAVFISDGLYANRQMFVIAH